MCVCVQDSGGSTILGFPWPSSAIFLPPPASGDLTGEVGMVDVGKG